MIVKRYIDAAYFKRILNAFYDTMIRISFIGNDLYMQDQFTGYDVKTLDYKMDKDQRITKLTASEIQSNILKTPLSYVVHRKLLIKQLGLCYGVIELIIDTEDDYLRAYCPVTQIDMLLSSVTNNSKAGINGKPYKEWSLSRIIDIFLGN